MSTFLPYVLLWQPIRHASTRIINSSAKRYFLQNVKRCRDHYAKKHSNKVWAWQYARKALMIAYKTHTSSHPNTLGLCMFNFVFLMPSFLRLLHTAMPTPVPCLNAFWHSDPYIFLHFVGNFFVSFLRSFVRSLIFSKDRQLHAAAANGEPGEFDSLQPFVA